MSTTETDTGRSALDELCINTIRTLSIDAVQKANSGHPGAPMGLAELAYVLYTRVMRHNPANADWPAATASSCRRATPRCSSTRCSTSLDTRSRSAPEWAAEL